MVTIDRVEPTQVAVPTQNRGEQDVPTTQLEEVWLDDDTPTETPPEVWIAADEPATATVTRDPPSQAIVAGLAAAVALVGLLVYIAM